MDSTPQPAVRQAGGYAEDLAENLRLVQQLAPQHCLACDGYHLARARRRLVPGFADALDRPDMVALIRDDLTRRRAGAGRMRILIAGSGDTNLLAICAESAALNALAPATIRYTVVDRCRTPLELCAAFARRHHLNVEVAQAEIGDGSRVFPADLIVTHSLLRFLPRDQHLDALGQLRDWLLPDGAMVFSHRLMSPEATGRSGEYRRAQDLVDLLRAAGFGIGRALETREENPVPGRDVARHRLLALLRPA